MPPKKGNSVAQRLALIIEHGQSGMALAKKLAREGVKTRADLKRPEILARLSLESQANVLFNPSRRFTLKTAQAVVAELLRRITPSSESIVVGSIRRKRPFIKDIDVLIITKAEPLGVKGGRAPFTNDNVLSSIHLTAPKIGDKLSIVRTYAAGTRRRSLILRAGRRHYRVDLFLATTKEKPYALFHYTGSAKYNIRIRKVAKIKGWRLNQYGLFDTTGKRIRNSHKVQTEQDLARLLGVSYRLPTDRE
jgi:DNA polymerase (family 10)